MPECVKTYRNTGSMVEAFQIQAEILDSYRDDFSKYLPRIDTMCLDTVFLNIARSIGEQWTISPFINKSQYRQYELLTKRHSESILFSTLCQNIAYQ
jgi:hypothetical protein